jgi:hypothetical protein
MWQHNAPNVLTLRRMMCLQERSVMDGDQLRYSCAAVIPTIVFEIFFFSNVATAPCGSEPPHYRGFTITLRYTTLGRTPLGEWSARRRDLTTHNTHKRRISIPPVGFEPAIPVSERPQTHALDRAATAIGTANSQTFNYACAVLLLCCIWRHRHIATDIQGLSAV